MIQVSLVRFGHVSVRGGAQDAEAIIFYLTGLWPDAANHRVALQPHLPNNLPRDI